MFYRSRHFLRDTMANLRYLRYVLVHKWFVIVAGRKLQLGWWQLLTHDLSKFSKAEWKPYVDKFYRDNPLTFGEAVAHHYRVNKHHWQYWIVNGMALQMPTEYVLEMVADWLGAGRAKTGHWNIIDWYELNRHKMNLHPVVRAQVDFLIPGYLAHVDDWRVGVTNYN